MMIRMLQESQEGMDFLELLLDEKLCRGTILADKELVCRVGGINERLPAKKKYELLLRIVDFVPVKIVEALPEKTGELIVLEDDEEEAAANFGWQTDCYIVGKYSRRLQENGVFDAVLETVLCEAENAGRGQETLTFLEQMIKRQEAFWHIDDSTKPILIYKGDDICHNVLTVFAEQFGNALERVGKHVIYFDVSRREISELTDYMYQRYQAVIGVQSYLFSVKMKDGEHYLHEYIYGPKYNFVFDHPVWMRQHLEHHYRDFYVLTHDMSYVEFTERYLKQKAFLFPPAGMSTNSGELERCYDISFVGTYGNYWNEVLLIHQMERKQRFLANRFLLKMRKYPNMTSEDAFRSVLDDYGRRLSDEEFLQQFHGMRRVIYCVMHYYRDRVLRSILESGIQLDVFGDSWSYSPLRQYSNLICHPDVTVEESLTVWKQSKLSLNIMSWHKGGFTERMANIMLAGAVLITDSTSYLTKDYEECDLVAFDLTEREKLPEQIKYLLENEEERNKIAENGERKTMKYHTWDRRAEEFLEILQRRECQ